MKKHFYLSLILIILALKGFAQPQFSYTQTPAAYNTIPFNNSMNLRQWIYYPSNFPGMPPGYINKIYIKAYGSVSPSFALLNIRMGTTSLTNFSTGPFATGLSVVYSGAYSAASISGNWLEITLQTPFYYDSLQNFIIECSQVGYSPGFNVMQTNSGVPGRSLAGLMTGASGTMQNVVAQVGFEIQVQSTPLAVKLKDFNASSINNENLLTWTVSEESEMDRYEIERSDDGISYEYIGTVYAENQSSETKYTYTDRSLPLITATGKLFYRLRMVEFGGTETVSPTVILNNTDKKLSFDVTAFPIPFSQNLTLSIALQRAQTVTVLVRDVTGRTILLRKEDIAVGTTNISLPELDLYGAGIYFITAYINEEQQTIRALKN